MIPLIFILAVLIGGSNGSAVKFTVSQWPTFVFVGLRSLVAILITLPFIVRSIGITFEKRLFSLFFVNILFAANWLIFAAGIQKTSIIMATLIYLSTSLVVGVTSFILFGERLTKNQIFGLILTMAGSTVLIMGAIKKTDNVFGTPVGNLLVVAAMLCWAFYYVFSSRISKQYSPLTIIFYNFVVSFILALLLTVLGGNAKNLNLINTPPGAWLGIAYVGVFSSAGYFYVNQWLIKHTSAFISSLQNYPATLVASVLGIIFFKESLTSNVVIAAALIMTGVFLATSYNYLINKISKS